MDVLSHAARRSHVAHRRAPTLSEARAVTAAASSAVTHESPLVPSRSALRRLAVAATLLALLTVFVLAPALLLAHVPTPRRGRPIRTGAYRVDVDHADLDLPSRSINRTDSLLEAVERLATTFAQSSADDALERFLDDSAAATATRWGQVVAYAKEKLFWSLQRYLGWSRTDAAGSLQMEALYVASEEQLHALAATWLEGRPSSLPADSDREAPRTLLDVGSGSGTETTKLAAALSVRAADTTCIETTASRWAVLSARGFRTASSSAQLTTTNFTAAALFNVLDRCDEPGALVDAAVHALQPGGLLLVATVLPFRAKVYEGRLGSRWGVASSRPPRSPLALAPLLPGVRPTFELRAARFLEAILRRQPALQLLTWTRLPYVCSGDTKSTHYTLDTAVLALRLDGAPITHHAPVSRKARSFRPSSLGASGLKGNRERRNAQRRQRSHGRKGSTKRVPCEGRAGDPIFAWLAATLANEGLSSWGDVLDAGAGLGSMCWLLGQPHGSLTGVTAREGGTYGASDLRWAAASRPEVDADEVYIVRGNWRDESFLRERRYDVVVADYLLGAVEQHWAHGADAMMDRLLAALRVGGYLLVVGLEPYDLVLGRSAGTQDRLILDIEAIGDSAAVIAGESTYRELPERWVRHQIERRQPEYRVVATRQFPMQLSAKTLGKQISHARQMAAKIDDSALQEAYTRRIGVLESELRSWSGTHNRARNYAVVIQRVPLGTTDVYRL
ncbi:hypothetical protein CYMTET_28913 [Cymbomonas tetramitiformis]|uniref:Uncharacterized protein n=1 Tax=Cymbomonas tetramitiformis TaxID=36881 RepID=A0AAE0KVF8_9CHLO|nr:hypothetical protein CYMTET_28913 [Cymbomonas tetramitiformis]|eukprot:gene12340-14574_t